MIVPWVETKAIRPERQWRSGPLIHVTFKVTTSRISRIILAPANQFSCIIDGIDLHGEIFAWMDQYVQGNNGGKLPLDFTPFTPFTKKGLEAIASIPFGELSTYGELAELVGTPQGARALGNVCNRNPFPLVIPCHRVVGKDGSLTGFAYGLDMKKEMLNFEQSL